MKNLLIIMLALSLGACKALDAIDVAAGMGDKMDKTNAEISKTNSAVHKQTLLVALNEMTKPENIKNIVPVPTSIMPAAKAFAEEATVEEIVELTYAWTIEVESVQPVKQVDADGFEVEDDLATQNKTRQEKLGKIYALYAIAGFIPQHKVEEMVQSEYYGSTRFQETALNILLYRAFFISEIFLTNSLLSKDFTNSGSAEEAVKYMAKVDYILNLKFVSSIGANLVPAGLGKDTDKMVMTLDQREESCPQLGQSTLSCFNVFAKQWTNIQAKTQKLMETVDAKVWSSNSNENSQMKQKEIARLKSTMTKINQYVNSWGSVLN